MENEERGQSRRLAESGSDANEDRQRKIQELYFATFGELKMTAMLSQPLIVIDEDAQNALAGLTRYLAEYSGPLTEEGLQEWASGIIVPAAAFHALRRQYEKSVLAGVWSVLKKARDLGEHEDVRRTAQMLAHETWVQVWEDLEEILTPGTAKLSTRLQAKAYWTARAWKTARLRQRDRFQDVEPERIGMDEMGNGFIEPEPEAAQNFSA